MNSRITVACLAVLAIASVAPADLLVHYAFDEGAGLTAADSGTAGATGALIGPGIGWTNNTPSGTDYALDLGPGRTQNNYVATAAAVAGLKSMTQFTVSMWINVQGTLTAGDRVFCNTTRNSQNPGIDMYVIAPPAGSTLGAGSFMLQMDIFNSATAYSTKATTVISADDSWLFVAFVFDGSARTLHAYSGDAAAGVAALGNAATNTITSLGASNLPIKLGGYSGTTESRTPGMLIDDFRIYNTAMDSAGLEAIRLETIPEPATIALLAAGAIVAQFKRRRAN